MTFAELFAQLLNVWAVFTLILGAVCKWIKERRNKEATK